MAFRCVLRREFGVAIRFRITDDIRSFVLRGPKSYLCFNSAKPRAEYRSRPTSTGPRKSLQSRHDSARC